MSSTEPIDPRAASALVHQAAEFGTKNGFRPPKDYEVLKHVLSRVNRPLKIPFGPGRTPPPPLFPNNKSPDSNPQAAINDFESLSDNEDFGFPQQSDAPESPVIPSIVGKNY
ncbi:MAG: hypothetical protein FWD57_15665 [Polyangiaceae bacterium]|nr:hypothetical protein [Polyangiaceae bacterium]